MQQRFLLISLFIFFCSTLAQAQITVGFSVDRTELCAPGVVQFTDNSSSTAGAITQWSWYRDGNLFSNLQHPGSLFSSPGVHQICLMVTDALGNSDSVCISNYIYAYASPVANFSVDDVFGCRPLDVNYTDLSTLGDAPLEEWRWDFGDGNVDTVNQHPAHSYTTIGTFDVTLVVIDSNGCRSSFLQSNLIQVIDSVTAGIAHNSFQVQCGLPAAVTFNGLSNGPGYTYSWNFGDNSPTVVSQNVSHNYLGAGCYYPTLTVSNGVCAATATIPSCITISDAPTASFTISNPTSCELPYTPSILNQSSGLTAFTWNFGDSTFSSTMYHPSHTYTSYIPEDTVNYQDGIIPIILTVSNAAGCVDSDTQLVYISIQTVDIVGPPLLCAPDTFLFFANTQNVSSYYYPVSWEWDLDDSLSTSGSTATVYYPDSGYYASQVIVTNNIGCIDTVQASNLIGIYPEIDSFTIDTNFICRLTGIHFTGYGSSFIDQWAWDFSDTSSQSGQSIYHQFQDTGFIRGYVTASFRNCAAQINLDSYYIYPPIALFTFDVLCDTLQVDFIDKAIGADHWFWDFGDTTTVSDTSTLQNPNYIYPGPGTYIVLQIVYNDSTGCVDSLRYPVIIGNSIADFDTPDSLCTVATVTPTNLSQNTDSYRWVASGSLPFTEVAETPTFVYQNPGIYDILLVVYDVNGCPDTSVQTIHIAGVIPNIQHSPDPVCRTDFVQFVDSSIAVLSPIVAWDWSPNSSTTSTATQPYFFPGIQLMTLELTNDWGCVIELVDSVFVGGMFLNYSSNQDICLGNLLTGVAITSSPSNAGAFAPFTYIWDYGNGDTDTSLTYVTNYTYDSAGVYDLCLSIVDSIGCVTTLCRPDWVEVHDPTALFTADTFYSSCPPLEVEFSNLSLSGSQWNWSFGDQSVSTLENPIHTYSSPGFYDVALEVVAFPGCYHRDTFFQMIQITGPSGDFVMPPSVSCAPYTAAFTGFGTSIASYTWLFGDGQTQTNINGSGTDTTYYTYDTLGVFVPQLYIEDSMGCRITIEHDTIVIKPTPSPAFSSDSLLCQFDSISYQLLTTISPGLTVEWQFEGGFPDSSTQFSPTVYYPDTGIFDVRLIVWQDGCSDTLLKQDYLQIKNRPIANFGIGILDTCAPVFVQFSDSSTTSDGFIQSWTWNLDNGQSASSQDTALWYNFADTFDIQLIVENNFGCLDTATQSFHTYPTPFVSAGIDSLVCEGDTLQLNGAGNANLLWTSNAWLSDSSIANPFTVLDSSYTYILEAYNNFGCRVFDTVTIQAVPFITVNAGDSVAICLGDTVHLQATGNAPSYNWGTSTSLSCQFCTNPIASPNSTSTYYLQSSVASTCATTDSVVVLVLPLPIAQIIADSSICQGDSLQLLATGGLFYNWLLGDSLTNDTIPNPIATPISNSNYLVEVIDSNNCRDSISVFIQVNSSSYTPLSDITICLGNSANLSLISGNNPIWIGDSLSCNTCNNPIARPTDSSQYLVQYYNNDNCPVEDTLLVNVLDLSALQALSSDTICIGDSLQLNVLGHHGAALTWSPNYALTSNSIQNPIAYPSVDTQYVVQVTAGQCTASDTIKITLLAPANILATDAIYCVGDTAQLFASGNVDNYLWSPANSLSDSSISNPYVTAISNQIYQVIGSSICGFDTAYSNVQVLAYPTMQLDSSIQPILGSTITLQTNANVSYNFTWSPDADLSCQNCPNPSWMVSGNQTFYVTVTNTLGCSVLDSIRITAFSECDADLVFVPNAFTPDGDGYNDILYLQSGLIQEIESFQIYSRWGQLVFESQDMLQGWDGSFKGQSLSPDVFGYFVLFKCPGTGEKILKKGNVTILR